MLVERFDRETALADNIYREVKSLEKNVEVKETFFFIDLPENNVEIWLLLASITKDELVRSVES